MGFFDVPEERMSMGCVLKYGKKECRDKGLSRKAYLVLATYVLLPISDKLAGISFTSGKTRRRDERDETLLLSTANRRILEIREDIRPKKLGVLHDDLLMDESTTLLKLNLVSENSP